MKLKINCCEPNYLYGELEGKEVKIETNGKHHEHIKQLLSELFKENQFNLLTELQIKSDNKSIVGTKVGNTIALAFKTFLPNLKVSFY